MFYIHLLVFVTNFVIFVEFKNYLDSRLILTQVVIMLSDLKWDFLENLLV